MEECKGELVMKIIKRSGTEEDFDISKIETAVLKANQSVMEQDRLTGGQVQKICREIEDICGNSQLYG